MTARSVASLVAAGALVAPAAADSLAPGSVLIFPRISSQNGALITAVSVTNTNLTPSTPLSLGGMTNVHFEYVTLTGAAPSTLPVKRVGDPLLDAGFRNANPEPNETFVPCLISNVVETLTPADTLTVTSACHNPSVTSEGYLVVTALDPTLFQEAWSFNHLIGSEFVLNANGAQYAEGDATDVDADGQLDFDGIEYVGIPDELYADSVVASTTGQLVLIALTGGPSFETNVAFDIWNDNEQPLSSTFRFTCWAEERFDDLSLLFSEAFLVNNTTSAPTETDVDCDGQADLETFWFRVRGVSAISPLETQPDPAVLGALTGLGGLDDGRPLWRSRDVQFNGDFLKFGVDDPEYQ